MIFLIYVLFLHWVADFVCQTDWMAQNKSKNLNALAIHVLTYSLVLVAGIFATFRFPIEQVFQFYLMNFAAHFLTDFWTSKLTSRLWAAGKKHNFFAVIGFDQFIHATTLVLTTRFLLGVT